MPLVIIKTLEGKTDEQKKRAVREVTEAIVKAFSVDKSAVWIIIEDIPKTNWGRSGLPATEWKK